jgi:hypothetical protein
MKKEFEFALKENDLRYQPAGASEFIFAKKFILKAPTVRQERIADKLSQMIMHAVKSNMNMVKEDKSDKKSSKKSEEKDSKDNIFTGDQILGFLKMAEIDFGDVKDKVKELLFDGSCLIDGTLPMRQDHYEKMDDLDTVNALIGEYLTNFFLSSLFSQKR